ncbi:hypothetical protein ACFVIN_01205 [Streptomyces prasinus]|uniref:hypothetical protein n=1 Tax=Streptomyces prasinus TaxID=67345 RepID=UPI003635E8BB
MPYCQRCDKAIKERDAQQLDNPGASGAGSTTTVCRIPCRPTPRQTSPAGLGR